MSTYAVLNFEDKIADTQKGAADDTIRGLKNRYEVTKQHKGLAKLALGRNTLTEYRCVVNQHPPAFTTDPVLLSQIRAACSHAEKIYLVMHGDPRDTDVCYTNSIGSSSGVLHLATAQQMGTFLAQVLSTTRENRLALVMCYGARCRDYVSANVNHQGMIPQADLVTSFAYRLYYRLYEQNIKARLSAVTWKICHDAQTGGAMVEVEEMIDLNMEFSEANTAKVASMKAALGEIKGLDKQDATYKADLLAWQTSSQGAALTQRSKDAMAARTQARDRLPQDRRSGQIRKYGKIAYRTKGNTLTIISKYGDSVNQMAPGTVLYSGPVLQPG